MSVCERSDCNPTTCSHSSHRPGGSDHVHQYTLAGFCEPCLMALPTWDDDIEDVEDVA